MNSIVVVFIPVSFVINTNIILFLLINAFECEIYNYLQNTQACIYSSLTNHVQLHILIHQVSLFRQPITNNIKYIIII